MPSIRSSPSRCLSLSSPLLLVPSTASADLTAFLGVNPTPTDAPGHAGFAGGIGLLIVGFEFEYANTERGPATSSAPGLKTYMFNGLLQTPVPIARMQFYGDGRRRRAITRRFDELTARRTSASNVGGGVKMTLVGPLRLRLDYRVFTLQGIDVRHSKPQRFYAGLNLKF